MKTLKSPAPSLKEPRRTSFSFSYSGFNSLQIQTLPPPGRSLHPASPLFRIVIETDQLDLARTIKSRLPQGVDVTVSEIETGRTSQAKLALPDVNPGFDAATFTDRQTDIAQLLLAGLSNKEIGRQLDLSHFTVRNHLSQIFRVLGVTSRKDAITKLGTSGFTRTSA